MSRYLALDYGDKRIGVAVSDETRTLATPLPYLDAKPFKPFLAKLRDLIKEKEVTLILIGLPRNMDGTYGPSAEKVREFIHHLKENILVPLQTVDERLSTVQASRALQEAGHNAKNQKTKIDSASAQIFLQSYLDSQQPFS
jgi:putative holliday junction resolvase